MTKLDLTKMYKQFYTSSPEPNIVEVPEANFLVISGRGAPGGDAYQRGLEALYSMAYRVKFMAKAAGNDFIVGKLEGLWWFDSPDAGTKPPREDWNWKSMIRQPEFVTSEMVDPARTEVHSKKKLDEALEVEFEAYAEGLSAQIMYVGPYAEEGPTITRLQTFIRENGYEMTGPHHEIYLNDPRKVPPEKLRTIIRQPIRKI